MKDPTPLIKKQRELREEADKLIVDGLVTDKEKYRTILLDIMALEEEISGAIMKNGGSDKIPL